MACLRSADQDTRNLGIRLAELSDFQSAAEPSAPARQYRGQTLADEPAAAAAASDETPRGTVRMYRGQRVYA
ncbi:hypothetical protein D3C78_1813020 [compost metagenome]